MTNKEKYQKAFSTLHASDHISLEVEIMEKNKRVYRMKKTAAACAAVALAFGSMTVAYAADFCGIQQKLTAWMHGERTELNVTDHGGGSYSYTYTDEDGQLHEESGGGCAIDDSGNEVPLSAEEVLDQIGNDVEADEDGNVWIYYYDKKINITDQFDENGECKVAFEHQGKTIWYHIKEGREEDGAIEGSYSYGSQTEAPKDADTYTFMEE